MATKATLIDFIAEKFEGPNGIPVSKAKLESFKKSDLEEFIEAKDVSEEFAEWETQKAN